MSNLVDRSSDQMPETLEEAVRQIEIQHGEIAALLELFRYLLDEIVRVKGSMDCFDLGRIQAFSEREMRGIFDAKEATSDHYTVGYNRIYLELNRILSISHDFVPYYGQVWDRRNPESTS
ncbi:MAG: hypothetical protein OXD46_04360 [Chloroflexi bacterium]|nr:hypothetical protein [Chloroflexota bacterium]